MADADGAVIDHFALGVYSTRIRAGRCTFLIDACEIRGALAVYHAFGTTVGRAADKIRKTGANGEAVCIPTLTIRSAGRRAARICFWQEVFNYWGTVGERIARIAGNASTDWQMINRLALGIHSASSWARVSAFQAHARRSCQTVRILRALGPAFFVGVT